MLLPRPLAYFASDVVETGEEGEETRFSARAKLFYFDSAAKAWKERGFGLLKLNVTKSNDDDDDEPDQSDEEGEPPTPETIASKAKQPSEPNKLARLLMRSEAVYRVILNVPVFKTLKAGDQNGDTPSDRSVKFTALEDKKPVMMQLRVRGPTPETLLNMSLGSPSGMSLHHDQFTTSYVHANLVAKIKNHFEKKNS